MPDLTETLAAMRQHEKYCDRGHGAYSALLSAVENVLALPKPTFTVITDSEYHYEEGYNDALNDVRKALTDALGGDDE